MDTSQVVERDEQEATGYPEDSFRVAPLVHDAEAVHAPMTLGPWACLPTGEQNLGALGVGIDDALGVAVFRVRPEGWNSVTAEISLDVLVPPPWEDGQLTASGRLRSLDAGGGLAECEVVDDSGAVLAIGTARCQFVPPPAAAPTADLVPAPTRRPPAPGALMDILRARFEPGERAGRLVLARPVGLLNHGGTVHGGVLFCVSELAGTTLAGTREAAGERYTSSVRMNYLRPGLPTGELFADAELVHEGRSASVYRVATSGAAGKPFTVATVTRRRR